MATETVKLVDNRAVVVEPKGTSFEETQVAYAPTPVAEGDYRNVAGDWKTAKGSSRKTLTEIREEQAAAYKKVREKGKNTVRENVTVELLNEEQSKSAKKPEKKSEPAKKAVAKK